MQGPVGGLSLVRVVVEHRDEEISECFSLGMDEMVPMENVRERFYMGVLLNQDVFERPTVELINFSERTIFLEEFL